MAHTSRCTVDIQSSMNAGLVLPKFSFWKSKDFLNTLLLCFIIKMIFSGNYGKISKKRKKKEGKTLKKILSNFPKTKTGKFEENAFLDIIIIFFWWLFC